MSIHSDNYRKAISSIDSQNGVVKGRPQIGLEILWHKDPAGM